MRLTLIAAAALFGACAVATLATAASPASPVPASLPVGAGVSLKPADAPAGAYTMDPRHSSVVWRLRHIPAAIYVARFDTVAGKLNFDSASPAKSTIEATIATNSVSTGLLNAQGEHAFDKEIGANILGGDANPTITFKATSIKVTGPQTGLITGDLTLKGVTKPVVLEAQFEGGGTVQLGPVSKYAISFTGRTIIDRSQFGAGNPVVDKYVGKEVEILVNAHFTKD
jgi:polyisoprenoid-binding protein YceI